MTSDESLQVLRSVFGHAGFRGLQADVVAALIAGRDAVALFPTGAGKSICYQVPALCRRGTGVVVSPLIALMRDQVEALRQAGVNAGALNSSTAPEDAARIRRDFRGRHAEAALRGAGAALRRRVHRLARDR